MSINAFMGDQKGRMRNWKRVLCNSRNRIQTNNEGSFDFIMSGITPTNNFNSEIF